MADSPGINLTTSIQKVVATDTAKSWLMFKPQGDNSIWIPLKVISWSWNGETEKIENSWREYEIFFEQSLFLPNKDLEAEKPIRLKAKPIKIVVE